MRNQLTDGSFTDSFLRLTQLLGEQQSLWRPRAFKGDPLDWQAQHPALARELLAMPSQQVREIQGDDRALSRLLRPHLDFTAELQALITLPTWSQRQLPAFDKHFHTGIPGRKWAQLRAFVASLPGAETGAFLEWCAGKAHLGRCLYHLHQRPVTSLEWNADLVAQGQRLSRQRHMAVDVRQVDVLAEGVDEHLDRGQHAVALHACGPLHQQLMARGVEREVKTLSIAPCCYQTCTRDSYRPLSSLAQASGLSLQREDLYTVVQETVTASSYVQRQREQSQQWRLGFDLLQRELRGVDEYMPVPSLPGRMASTDFQAFCRAAAARKGLDLPLHIDWQKFERAGRERFVRVSALDLVRLLFRRPLEVWLVLDYALFLQHHHYRVSLGTFCERHLTPRNILLNAQRRD